MPPCIREGRCPLGELGPRERRALNLRARLISLRDLVGAEAVLKMAGADDEDVELLAAIEDEMRMLEEEKQARQGNG